MNEETQHGEREPETQGDSCEKSVQPSDTLERHKLILLATVLIAFLTSYWAGTGWLNIVAGTTVLTVLIGRMAYLFEADLPAIVATRRGLVLAQLTRFIESLLASESRRRNGSIIGLGLIVAVLYANTIGQFVLSFVIIAVGLHILISYLEKKKHLEDLRKRMGELAERMTDQFFDISDASKPRLLVALSLAIGLLVAWMRTDSIVTFLVFSTILAAITYFLTNMAINKQWKPRLRTVGSILLVLLILNGWQETAMHGKRNTVDDWQRQVTKWSVIDEERLREQVRRAERNMDECMRKCPNPVDFPVLYEICVKGCSEAYNIAMPK